MGRDASRWIENGSFQVARSNRLVLASRRHKTQDERYDGGDGEGDRSSDSKHSLNQEKNSSVSVVRTG